MGVALRRPFSVASDMETIPLLLARHAQTTANVGKWISGWRNDVDLTHEGVNQAHELGRRLKQRYFDHEIDPTAEPGEESLIRPVAIISSDLYRAHRTTKLLNKALNLPVETDPGLRERNYGEWTGRPYEDLGNDPAVWKDASAKDPNHKLWHYEEWAPPEGETLVEMRNRAVEAVNSALARWDNQPLLIVAHRGTIRALLQHLNGLTYPDTPSPPNPPEWMEIEWTG